MPKASHANVRFGSKADIEGRPADVRFTPKSGHSAAQTPCLLRAETEVAESFERLMTLTREAGP